MLRLAFERIRRGWSQTLLGSLVYSHGYHRPLSQSEVSLYEAGRLTPKAGELEALSRALNVLPAESLLLEVVDVTTREPA